MCRQATGVLNPAEPVAVLMFSVLHVLAPEPGNDLAARLMSRCRELVPAGSYLGVSHVTADGNVRLPAPNHAVVWGGVGREPR